MGSENSSEETKARAKKLSQQVGSYHLHIVIGVYSASTIYCLLYYPVSQIRQ